MEQVPTCKLTHQKFNFYSAALLINQHPHDMRACGCTLDLSYRQNNSARQQETPCLDYRTPSQRSVCAQL